MDGTERSFSQHMSRGHTIVVWSYLVGHLSIGELAKSREIVKARYLLGLGSVSKEERERITLKTESAGDQLCLRISIQTFPRSDMFMWYILITDTHES